MLTSTLRMITRPQQVAGIQRRMIFSKFFSSGSNSDPSNPRVFFDISRDNQPVGRMTFELYNNKVPKTAENFRAICTGDNKFGYTYEGSHFHRIIDGFMAQGGDFTRHNGTGGASIYGSKFADEAAGLQIKHTKRGLLSMANAGPNTNGSQFFITFVDTPWLNGAHVVFGELVEGDEILKAMEAAGTRSGQPRANFSISKSGQLPPEPAE